MEITKEKILERISALKKDRLHYEKMCILVDGALQDCEYFIEELESQPKDNGVKPESEE